MSETPKTQNTARPKGPLGGGPMGGMMGGKIEKPKDFAHLGSGTAKSLSVSGAGC